MELRAPWRQKLGNAANVCRPADRSNAPGSSFHGPKPPDRRVHGRGRATFMTTTTIGTAILLTLCFAGLSLADDRPGTPLAPEAASVATEKSAGRSDPAVILPGKPVASAAVTTTSSEVFQNVVIAAGQTYPILSTMDYSSADTVAVTVECTLCTTTATSLASSGLILQAGWTVPNAVSYVVAENKAATAFLYTDVGSALFNVYGTQFKLILQNKGTASIAIQQVTLFRRGQSTVSN